MAHEGNTKPRLAFDGLGLRTSVELIKDEIRELYQDDAVPWVIGYSGGKDSTAVLQLVWLAVAELPLTKRTKPIHVISTDTLVENPIVASWVNGSLDVMRRAADEQDMPIKPHRLTPGVDDSFWVNLIGRGYPAPRNKFRWCTLRLKITPSHTFIRNVVRENGEAILVLGTRRAESSARAHNMATHAKRAVRDRLTPNSSLLNSLIYTPIEMWSNDEVWAFLTQVKNPWGYNNHDLMSMYRGASADGECPLVVDTSTPSCGNSRFGCYVCTLVDQDKSMAAMIQNDREKEWMEPLLALRNALDFRGDANRKREWGRRDFRRIDGRLTLYTDAAGVEKLVHGPYRQEVRAEWLQALLETQRYVRENAPKELRDWQLVTLDELQEIRRIWVTEKHEIEDLLPGIYERVMGEPYPAAPIEDDLVFGRAALELLRKQCGGHDLHYEMVRNLLDVERKHRTKSTRRGLFDELGATITRCQYDNEQDALDWAKRKKGEVVQSTAEDIVDEDQAEPSSDPAPQPAPVQLRVKRAAAAPSLFDSTQPAATESGAKCESGSR
jgi:DNA sulfur modification protein DndC